MKKLYIVFVLTLLVSCSKKENVEDIPTCIIPIGKLDVVIHNETNKQVVQLNDGYDNLTHSYYTYETALKFKPICNSNVCVTTCNFKSIDSVYVNVYINGGSLKRIGCKLSDKHIYL